MWNHGLRIRARRRARPTLSLIAGLLAAGAFAAPIPPAEKLLPDDTLAVITAPDFVKLRDLLRQSPQSQLWRDPVLKPFRDKFLVKWDDEFIKPLERDLNLRLTDYLGLPQGQLTFAFTQNGWDGQSRTSPAYLLLLDAKDRSDQLKTNLADVRKKWVDAGKTLRTEKIRDVEFAILTLTSNDVPKTLRRFTGSETPQAEQPGAGSGSEQTETKRELAVGQFESLLILGNSTKAIEKVVARLTGGALPALGEVAAFEADRLAHFRDAPFYGWVNAQRIVEVLNKLPTPQPLPDQPPPLDLKAVLAATGLSGLKTLACSCRDTGDGSMFQFTLGVPESARTGLLKTVAPEAKDAAPPAFVPADAVKFQRLRVDGQKAWTALEKLAQDLSPTWARVLDDLVAQANKDGGRTDPGFEVKRDLIGNLGDDLVTWQKPPRGSTLEELEHAPSLVLLGSPNAEKLALALRNLFAAAVPQASPATEREFLGRKIYTATPPMFSPPDNPQGIPPTVSYATSGGYVGFSEDVALLEEWLRSGENPPKPLREKAGLAEAMQKVGGASTGWISVENQADLMRATLATFKKDASAAANVTLSGPLNVGVNFATEGKGLQEWFDFSLLPEWDAVSKYFHFIVTSGAANADGLTYRYFSPTPPGLKK